MADPPDSARTTPDGDPPLDLGAVLRAVDREWPGWERAGGRLVPAPWGYLIGVESNHGQLLHRPLDTHPAEALTGWEAPRHWCALGVAVRGTARRSARTGDPGSDARVVWVCHRDGRSASLLGIAGDPVAVVVTEPGGSSPDEGRVPRLLRRALGGRVPTRRPAAP